jgi:hypothetical protein
MNRLLFATLTAFGRAFLVAFLLAATGILTAPNLSAAIAMSVAALVGALSMGLRAIQVFIPKLSFATILPQPFAAWADSFTRAFLASFITLLTGWLAAPDWSNSKAAITGIVVGALTMGVRALQGLFTSGDSPAPNAGA